MSPCCFLCHTFPPACLQALEAFGGSVVSLFAGWDKQLEELGVLPKLEPNVEPTDPEGEAPDEYNQVWDQGWVERRGASG